MRSQIGRQILDAIVNGTFRPGEQLGGNIIAEQLGVGGAPVREALSALEQEGIVVQIPRRGYFVADFTRKDIAEVYSLRLLLELAALERIIGHVAQKDLDQLQHLIDCLEQAMGDSPDLCDRVLLDLEFHRYLCFLSHHDRLCAVWNRMHLQTHVLFGAAKTTPFGDLEDTRVWHQQILDAIGQEDHAAAEAVLTDHIKDAEQRAISAFEIPHVQIGTDSNAHHQIKQVPTNRLDYN